MSKVKHNNFQAAITGNPKVTTICLVAVWNYNSIQKSDFQPLLELLIAVAFSQSCDQNLGAWHLACIYIDCSVLGSCDHHLRPLQPTSDKQNPWGKLDILNGCLVHSNNCSDLLNNGGGKRLWNQVWLT